MHGLCFHSMHLNWLKSIASTENQSTRRLWLIVLAFCFLLTAVVSLDLWHLRREAISGQTRELGLLSLALSDEIDRGLQGVQEGLHAMATELGEGRLPLRGADAERALRTRAELMSLVKALWLVDQNGRTLSGSDSSPMPDLTAFSPALGQLGDQNAAVSRPFVDLRSHESMVALSIRFKSNGGSTDGWILAAMPASTLLGAFSAATPAADARMAVYRSDGVLLAGSIVTTPRLDEANVSQRLARPRSIEVRQFRDGSERLVSLHTLSRFELKIMLTRNLKVVLLGWREAAQIAAFGLVLVLGMLLISVFFVQRADQRRRQVQRTLQAQLARTSKLESMGTLAGGVAHDFNNVLAAIVGFGEMARDAAPEESDQARHLDKVLQAAMRGKKLIERVLTFSRGGARSSIAFELEPVVAEVMSLLIVSMSSEVVLEQELNATDGRVRGDPTQAFEAVMNLCTNAMQSMPNGGMLSVQLNRVSFPEAKVLSHSKVAKGNYLALAVSDQGSGITVQVMEHLFEPFFTTRSAKEGTGLGLAVVHGVMAEFSGAIDVQSESGHGACFTLYFPECTDPAESPGAAIQIAPRGAGQQLLVVDDEPALVAMTEEMLKGLGYEPEGYTDPVAALQALRVDPRRFAALITDEVMPKLTGTQLTEDLRVFAPDIPVLLISGYGGALLAQRAIAAGVTRVLAKPLERADLARALAELLR